MPLNALKLIGVACICRLAAERDGIERESREKETRILNLNRDLEELRERLESSERQKQQQARELDDLMSSKDDVGKNVCRLASKRLEFCEGLQSCMSGK